MGWGGVVQRANRIQYELHRALDIPRDLCIPEPQHLKPLQGEPFIPTDIPRPTMPTPVNLDYQPPPQIGEIRDVRPNGSLPPEMQPQHPVQFPQLRPKLPLLGRHFVAQLPGICTGDGVDNGHVLLLMPKTPQPNPS
jgi:hypothetical protein